jgi:hypothetical protein
MRQTLDQLAVDYAAIYLTGAYGASPCESVWTDDDHLACQAPCLHCAKSMPRRDSRPRIGASGRTTIWSCSCSTLPMSCGGRTAPDELRRLAAMMDEHLLRWLPDFAARVAARCETPFFAVLGRLTFAWCEQLRDLLAERLGEARPSREESRGPSQAAAARRSRAARLYAGRGAKLVSWRPHEILAFRMFSSSLRWAACAAPPPLRARRPSNCPPACIASRPRWPAIPASAPPA